MELMASARAAPPPLASTVIFCERSPRATAVAIWAMLRTWSVRLEAMKLTLSVRSFQVPETPPTLAWPPRPPVRAALPGHTGDLVGERAELVDHGVHRLFQLRNLAEGIDGDLL